MKTRIISGLCMVPLVLLLYFGGVWLAALCIFVGFMGVREFYNGFRTMGWNPSEPIAVIAILILYGWGGVFPEKHLLIIPAWIVLVVFMCSLLMFNVKKHTPLDALATMVGIFYIVFFSYHVMLVDQSGEFSDMKWLIILSAFGSDICAYFTGVFLGKHKMCPLLSPKKTFEGLFGGILGSAIICGVFGYIFMRPYFISCILIGVLGAVVSVAGDLTASAYKRKMGIKDYGTLIPGHGGIMDRFDSVLFTAPFVYYYIFFVLERSCF